MIVRVLNTLLYILRLRSGPQDLPAGWPLAIVLCVLYLSQGLLAYQFLGDEEGAPRSLVAIVFQVLIAAVLLNAKNLGSRLPQTISAIAGVGCLFGLLSVALLVQADPERQQPVLYLLFLTLFFWSLVVDGHIYKYALSIRIQTGLLVAVLIFGANYYLQKLLFG